MSQLRNCHIRQREAYDCVIATVAAVANMPYESVAELAPRKPGKLGLYPREVRKLLQNATQIKWRFPRTVFFRRLRFLCDSEDTVILFIRPPGNVLLQRITRKTRHCIFVRGGHVFDPECNDAILAGDYDRIHWIPTTAFYPVDSRTLKEIQGDNRSRYRKERFWSEISGGWRTP